MILERSAHGCPVHKAALEALPRTGTLKATFRFDRQLGVAYISRGRKERTAHGLGHLALRAAERAQVLGGLEQKLALLSRAFLAQIAAHCIVDDSGEIINECRRAGVWTYKEPDIPVRPRRLLPRSSEAGRRAGPTTRLARRALQEALAFEPDARGLHVSL